MIAFDPSSRVTEHDPSSRRCARIDRIRAAAYDVPTSAPEADGTAEWSSTTLVVVHVAAGGVEGLGYSYAGAPCAALIDGVLADVVLGCDAMATSRIQHASSVAVRNLGRPGMAACAISAIDTALWDLKAKLLDIPLVDLFGASRDDVPVYGSGGFTTEGPDELLSDIERWRRDGIRLFKIKIGRDRDADRRRIDAIVAALADGETLFVDANGAYTPKDALSMAAWMGERGVAWFEEPVSSDDRPGLRFVRERAPPCMSVAAGEYGYTPDAFRALLEGGAVDVLQADSTRCLGFTGFLQAAALCDAWHRPLSSHCAPALQVAAMCHAQRGVHMEYFHDHVRIESMLFDGVPDVRGGRLVAQRDRPGHGLSFRERDAERFRH